MEKRPRIIKKGDNCDNDGFGVEYIRLTAAECLPYSDSELRCMFGFNAYYGGPGLSFGREAKVIRVKNVVIMARAVGWDI